MEEVCALFLKKKTKKQKTLCALQVRSCDACTLGKIRSYSLRMPEKRKKNMQTKNPPTMFVLRGDEGHD